MPGSSILRHKDQSKDVWSYVLDPILAQFDLFCKCIKTAISCDVFFDFFRDVRSGMVGFKGARDPNNIS